MDRYVQKMRPWLNEHGRSWVEVEGVKQPSEVRALLTKEEWSAFDAAALSGFEERCKSLKQFDKLLMVNAWESYVVEKMIVSPDHRQLVGISLPVISSPFWIPDRMLEVSRRRGVPVDTTIAEACGRRVGEKVEEVLAKAVPGSTLICGQELIVIRQLVTVNEEAKEGFLVLCSYATDLLLEGEAVPVQYLSHRKRNS